MSQYKAYTVAVANGSATVTGTLTAFLANVKPGDAFLVAGDVVTYPVAAVVDDLTLTLATPYLGADQGAAAYRITRDFTPHFNLAEISKGDADWATILNIETLRKIDVVMAGLTLGDPQQVALLPTVDAKAALDAATLPSGVNPFVTTSEVNALAATLGTMASKNFWAGTQAAYDAIVSKDVNTLYFITEV